MKAHEEIYEGNTKFRLKQASELLNSLDCKTWLHRNLGFF